MLCPECIFHIKLVFHWLIANHFLHFSCVYDSCSAISFIWHKNMTRLYSTWWVTVQLFTTPPNYNLVSKHFTSENVKKIYVSCSDFFLPNFWHSFVFLSFVFLFSENGMHSIRRNNYLKLHLIYTYEKTPDLISFALTQDYLWLLTEEKKIQFERGLFLFRTYFYPCEKWDFSFWIEIEQWIT